MYICEPYLKRFQLNEDQYIVLREEEIEHLNLEHNNAYLSKSQAHELKGF